MNGEFDSTLTIRYGNDQRYYTREVSNWFCRELFLSSVRSNIHSGLTSEMKSFMARHGYNTDIFGVSGFIALAYQTGLIGIEKITLDTRRGDFSGWTVDDLDTFITNFNASFSFLKMKANRMQESTYSDAFGTQFIRSSSIMFRGRHALMGMWWFIQFLRFAYDEAPREDNLRSLVTQADFERLIFSDYPGDSDDDYDGYTIHPMDLRECYNDIKGNDGYKDSMLWICGEGPVSERYYLYGTQQRQIETFVNNWKQYCGDRPNCLSLPFLYELS